MLSKNFFLLLLIFLIFSSFSFAEKIIIDEDTYKNSKLQTNSYISSSILVRNNTISTIMDKKSCGNNCSKKDCPECPCGIKQNYINIKKLCK